MNNIADFLTETPFRFWATILTLASSPMALTGVFYLTGVK